MPTPVNNGTPGVLKLDQKLTVAAILSVTQEQNSLTGDASTKFTSDLVGQNASRVVVPLEGSVALAESPADLGGVWAATPVTAGGDIEIDIPKDEYVKYPLDR